MVKNIVVVVEVKMLFESLLGGFDRTITGLHGITVNLTRKIRDILFRG